MILRGERMVSVRAFAVPTRFVYQGGTAYGSSLLTQNISFNSKDKETHDKLTKKKKKGWLNLSLWIRSYG